MPVTTSLPQDADAAFERSERRANELQTGVSDAERALQVLLLICIEQVHKSTFNLHVFGSQRHSSRASN